MDATTQIELLSHHAEKINEKDFDLDAWKSTAITLVTKIFGNEDPRIASIDGLKIDYGSWALRDASSKYDPVATCKRKARDIMELSIVELKSGSVQGGAFVLEALKDSLTGSQFKEIRSIIESDKSENTRTKQLTERLKSLKAPLLSEILSQVIMKSL